MVPTFRDLDTETLTHTDETKAILSRLYLVRVTRDLLVRDETGAQAFGADGAPIVLRAGPTIYAVYADGQTFGAFQNRAVLVPLNRRPLLNAWQTGLERL